MQLQDLPIPAVALKIAIDCNPLRITPDTFLIDAIALMSQERTRCGLGHSYSVQSHIESRESTHHFYHKSSNAIRKSEESATCVFVMQEEKLVGLLTQRDFIRFAAQRINLETVKAADVMTRHLITLNQSDIRDSLTILNLFREHCIHHLPILNNEGQLVGMVTSDSLINGLQDQLNQHRQTIASLHAEKIELWENRQTELEKQASDRTAELARLNAQLRQQIQEREGMETALQQEFDLLARIMETSPVGIVMVNPKGRIILASDQAQRVLGLTKEEIGKRAYKAAIEQISDQDGNVLLEDDLLFRQVMTTEQAVYDVRHAIKCPDGRRVLLSINGAPLFDLDDQLKGVVFAIEDVTEQVRAEEELRQTKNQLEVILEGTADGINVLDPTGRLIYVNEAAAKAAGYASAQVMLQEFDSNKVFDQFEIVDESGEAFPLDQLPGRLALQSVQHPATTVRFRIKATGQERWSSIKATPIFDSQGNVRFSVIVTHDITELKQAEEALRQSEERFRTVADFTYDWEYWIEPDGNFIYISPSCDRTTGYRVDEFLNNPSLLQSIIHPDDRTRFAQHRCEDRNTQKAS
ncbi:MAG TPA: hypothetical protein DEG47_13790, partial [Cyanobacteria bacterium UBA11148]|nr:hypothetical protein [Cyanobacteria bacterium UBA11148]